MKKLVSFLMVLMLLFSVTVSAFAAASTAAIGPVVPTQGAGTTDENSDGELSGIADLTISDAVSSPVGYAAAYRKDGTLYTYLYPYEDEDAMEDMVLFGADDVTSAVPVKLSDEGKTLVSYHILIDPVVIRDHYDSVSAFMSVLLKEENSRFCLNVTGMPIDFDYGTGKEVGKQFAELFMEVKEDPGLFIDEESDPVNDTCTAAEEIEENERENNELSVLLVLSDDSFVISEAEKMMLHHIPEVQLDVVRFGAKEDKDWISYPDSDHGYFMADVPDQDFALPLADDLIARINGLYVARLNWSAQEESDEISLKVSTSASPDADLVITGVDQDAPAPAPVVEEPTQAATEPATADQAVPNNFDIRTLIIIIACVIAALLIAAAVVLFSRRKPRVPKGVPMLTVEVICGVCYNVAFSFVLDRSMSIGTDTGCDLVFADEAMAPVNSQIAIVNGSVMITDAEQSAPTYIGGMKIFGSNVLRSGDILTIGSTTFKVTF